MTIFQRGNFRLVFLLSFVFVFKCLCNEATSVTATPTTLSAQPAASQKSKKNKPVRQIAKVRRATPKLAKKPATEVELELPYRQFDKENEREEEKRQAITGEGLRFDEPAEAAAFFKEKRLPAGAQELPLDHYVTAREHAQKMPRYSLAAHQFIQPAEPGNLTNEALPAAWAWLGPGNVGGRTRALLIDPTATDTMYAGGASGGIWKTTNAGTLWTPIADLLANINITVLTMAPQNPNVIYAGTGEYYNAFRGAGIFKTTDGGATWAQLTSTNNSDFYYLFDIVVSPNNAQRIYAATDKGVFRSLDGGTTWTRTFSSGNQTGVIGLPYDLAIRSDKPTDDLLMAFYKAYPTVEGQFYRNADAGGTGTWTATLSEAGLSRAALAIAPTNQNTVYAIGVSNASGNPYYNALHAFYKSTDGGQTWTATVRNTDPASLNTSLLSYLGGSCNASYGFSGQGFYDLAIAADPVNENSVWVGGITWFRSDDGGKNWGVAAYSGASYVHPDNHAIAFHPNYNGTTNQTIFLGNDGGVYRTDNGRAAVVTNNTAFCAGTNPSINWRAINNSFGVTQFYHGVVYPDGKTYFGGTQDNGTVRSNDTTGSNGWNFIRGGDGGYVAVDPTNTNILYVENTRLSLVKSTNGGSSYASATNGITGDSGFRFITPFTMETSDPQRLWIGGTYMWRTTDGAANWTRTSQTLSGNVSAMAVAPTDSNYAAAGTGTGYFYRTTTAMTADSSTVWASTQIRSGYLSWLAFDPLNRNTIYATFATFGGKHVWKSTDAGTTWANIDGSGTTALPDIPVHCIVIDPANTQRLFIGTDTGVFVSLDGGANWASENTGFANVIVESLALNTVNGVSTLYAFTHGRGVWRVNIGSGCTYTLATKSQIFDANGGAGSVNVTGNPAAGCAWTASSNVPWITVNNFDSATVNYSVAANADGITRQGSIAVAGKTFYVTQTAIGVSTISPTSASSNSAAFTLTVNGTGFANNCVVRWNGTDRATTFVSATQITAQILVADLATVGTANVTVYSPAPTSTTSAKTFTITALAPTLNALNPTSAAAGGSLFALNVQGTNFVNGSTIRWNGANRTTLFVNNTILTAAISASDIANAGTASITVFTPAPGGGISQALSFPINYPAPTLSGINPTSAIVGSADFTLTVTGTKFVNGAVIRWNGVDQATTFVSNTQLTTTIKAAALTSSGTAKVTVFNPAPGGGLSAEQSFTLNSRPIATVSAADYTPTAIGKDAIASAFGMEMATALAVASSLPLPTNLSGTTVKVKDSAGVERLAPLFFVSPTQVNFQIPIGTAAGTATLTITSGDGKITTGTLQIATVAPGIFSADSTGTGIAAANIQRVAGNGNQTFENVARYDSALGKMVGIPVAMNAATDQVYLVLYGTGIRYNSGLTNVKATVGGLAAQMFYAGQHCCYIGVDQLNILLPPALAGRGEADVVITVDGKVANTVKLNIQ